MIRFLCDDLHTTLDPERVAYWYLRLNGFLTTQNFILHPTRNRGSQRTDADIFGVRFPFRKEQDYLDDSRFSMQKKPYFIIAEVKRSLCKLNGPWTTPGDENMQYVLRAIGEFEEAEIDRVAKSLYEKQVYEDKCRMIQVLGIGGYLNTDDGDAARPLFQIHFREIASFIYRRFQEHRGQKRNHQQWDPAGQHLWELSEGVAEPVFVERVMMCLGINPALAAKSKRA